MSLGTLLLIVLIILLVGGLPQMGIHNSGYLPSGGIGLILLIVIILLICGRL